MELTREKVLAMGEGSEMDRLVAERVMDAVGVFSVGDAWFQNASIKSSLPSYSTDITAAWKVVKKLKRRGLRLHLAIDPDYTNVDVIRTKVAESMGNGFERIDGCTDVTTEVAICRVALLATLSERLQVSE